ncbi:hypothetical protein NKI61_19795 [Mesorhizobium sp. M0514]|uniref:hypothetical protein n=1 Tax=Mesorhizobium sp. M0514 TaxID=2956955 RepID=UPI00333BA28D
MKMITDKRTLTERAQTLAEFLQAIEDAGVDLAAVHIEDESGNRFGVAKMVEEAKDDGSTVVDLVLCIADQVAA